MSFEELEVLEHSKAFIFDNKASIKNIQFMLASSETEVANSQQARDQAVPGKPGIMFFWADAYSIHFPCKVIKFVT